jgi:hypothetical protein
MRKAIISGKFVGLFVVGHTDFSVIDKISQTIRRMNRQVFSHFWQLEISFFLKFGNVFSPRSDFASRSGFSRWPWICSMQKQSSKV